jgi:hypothetical protein
MPLAAGTRLGHYEILEKTGAAGMGVAMPLQAQNANTRITVVLNWEAGLKP